MNDYHTPIVEKRIKAYPIDKIINENGVILWYVALQKFLVIEN
jgi:hypothetical protein